MYDLKQIRHEAIPSALERAHRYRLLNEPHGAESICRDIVEIEPDHQEALVTLLLALTDQFQENLGHSREEARLVLSLIRSEYEREYYAGVISERAAKALLHSGHAPDVVYDSVMIAMKCYERAIPLASGDDDEAILRWNACVRLIRRHQLATPKPTADLVEELGSFEDEVPYR